MVLGIAFAVILLAGYQTSNEEFQKSEKKRLNELYFLKFHSYMTDYKSLKKYFDSHPEIYEECLRIKKERDEISKKVDEKLKKQNIMNRIFAYDYEDMLYTIYLPTAREHDGKYTIGRLTKDRIISGICEYKNISRSEAEILFEDLYKHGLFWGGRDGEYSLILVDSIYWNIVSDSDMNFDKWMKKRNLQGN